MASVECRCKVELVGVGNQIFGRQWKIEYCPRHGAVEKLLAVLQQMLDWDSNLEEFGPCCICASRTSGIHRDGCMIGQWIEEGRKAIASAKVR